MIQNTCVNHPQRKAVGVCVMTGKAICNECSTRYKGVNYSREGLEMLKARRQAQPGAGGRVGLVVALLSSPLLLGALLLFFFYSFVWMIDLQQVGL